MKKLIGVVALVILFGVAAPAASAADMSVYTSGEKPVVYESRFVGDVCGSTRDSISLWAKDSGHWRKVVTSKPVKRTGDLCVADYPYLNRLSWSVDALGTPRSPLRYELELSWGKRPGQNAFTVNEYGSKKALGEHFLCIVTYRDDPVGQDVNC